MQRSHHSFQATVGPRRGDAPPLRNPWVEKHPDSSSSSASRSIGHPRRYQQPRPGPPPASEWLRPPPSRQMHGPLLNHPVQQPTLVRAGGPSLQGSSPGVSVVGSGGGAGGDGCAGEGCDSFCYHCLQVVYIAGILTGISLIIAGSVLRGNPRRGDLLVLVYIGVLLAAVCTLLLSVHYCVRRNVKKRKRALRLSRLHPRIPQTPEPMLPAIPLQDLAPPLEIAIPEIRHGHSMPRTNSNRSRSSHSHGRRYYLTEQSERPLEEWERQPYQLLIHRPR